MSPTAAGMAATLHVLTALALWWATPVKNFEVPEHAIEVTMEQPPAPKAETPPPPLPPAKPPGAQAQPAPPPSAAPQSAARPGLPPAEAKPTPTDKTTVPLGLPPPGQRTTEPPQTAAAQPAPPAKEAPTPEPPPVVEQKLPQVDAPPAPLSMQDFVRAAPPPPPQEIVRPQPRVQPTTPPPPTPTVQKQPQQLQPSPLHTQQEQQRAPSDNQASASFVNPADTAARTRVQDDYLWQVGKKISEHRAFAANNSEQGTVVLRLTIARDGRLMEAGIARSSGFTTLDAAVLNSARQAAPYPGLPGELAGAQVTFILPLGYRKYD